MDAECRSEPSPATFGCPRSGSYVAAHDSSPYAAAMARFEKVRETFWSDSPVGVQPSLTDEMIADAELLLGVRLPSELLDLLRLQNGGVVAEAWNSSRTTVRTSWSDSHVPFDTMYGIGVIENNLSLLDTPYLVDEWDLTSPLVLLTGDGHWWIALDYRERGRDGRPSVTWFDTGLDQESHLAPDFRSFVQGLAPEPADEAVSRASDGL